MDRVERYDFCYSFSLSSFLGGKRKGEKNNQSRDFKNAFLLDPHYHVNTALFCEMYRRTCVLYNYFLYLSYMIS